jgi:hypothetical protein
MATAAIHESIPNNHNPPRTRRWIPLTLRMFVAILFLLGAGSAFWIGVPAYQQHTAIREIERLGGLVDYGRVGPEWLRELLGEERMHCIDEVEHVHFRPDKTNHDRDPRGQHPTRVLPYTIGPTVDDSTLVCIAKLPRLKGLSLRWANVTDDSMRHISQIHDLKYLCLKDTRVSDTGGKLLAQLTNLESLSVSGSKLTEAGLIYLKNLPKLERLEVDCTQITTAAAPWLSEMPSLKCIFVKEVDYNRPSPVAKSLRLALPGVEVAECE